MPNFRARREEITKKRLARLATQPPMQHKPQHPVIPDAKKTKKMIRKTRKTPNFRARREAITKRRLETQAKQTKP